MALRRLVGRVTGQATIIYGEVVAGEGGETHFCDMHGAYERLTPDGRGGSRTYVRCTTSISRAPAATARTR